MGDSAGGNAVVSVMAMLRERNLALPRCAVLISPWVDLSMSSITQNIPTDFLIKCVTSCKKARLSKLAQRENETVARLVS